jgi:hypothetical protein
VELVVRFVSQPSAALLLQLPNPVLHVIPQLPPVHDATPPCELQVLPQEPQFEVLPCRLTSQPLPELPSQLPKPELQLEI